MAYFHVLLLTMMMVVAQVFVVEINIYSKDHSKRIMGTANFTILYLCEMKGKCTIETAGQAVDESGKSVRTIVHAHSGTYVG